MCAFTTVTRERNAMCPILFSSASETGYKSVASLFGQRLMRLKLRKRRKWRLEMRYRDKRALRNDERNRRGMEQAL